MGWVEGWGEDGWDDEAVNRAWWGGIEGVD
jgi:hypothetical protein